MPAHRLTCTDEGLLAPRAALATQAAREAWATIVVGAMHPGATTATSLAIGVHATPCCPALAGTCAS